jgi:hypothetical protein
MTPREALLHRIPYHGGFGASRAYTCDHPRHSSSWVKREVKNASRGVEHVVSDVSVLCPRAVVGFDNYSSLPMDMGVRRWALTSDSTLRFRERAEVDTSLVEHG